MEKRAQVTAFIIIGIVIVAVIGVFLYARNTGLGVSPERFIADKKTQIEDKIDSCTREQASRVLDLIGKQGGTVAPVKALEFNGNRVSYLCYNIPGTDKCVNRILTLTRMEEEISRYLENNLRRCINLNDYRTAGLSLEPGNLEVTTTIGRDNVLFVIDYPITLSRDNARLTIPRTTTSLNVPLGRLFLTAVDIIDSEAQIGDFDPLPYMLVHNLIRIEKHRPYPHKVYKMNVRATSYIFQLAIEGEP